MTIGLPDPFGLRQCDRTLAIVEREIRELRGDEMAIIQGGYTDKEFEALKIRQKQEKEVFDYVVSQWTRIQGKPWGLEERVMIFTVRTILHRYDLLDTEDMPKPRKPSDGHGDWGG